MAEEAGEKSLAPTPHRRQQARDAGQVAHSQDLSSAALLVGGMGALLFAGGTLFYVLVGLVFQALDGQSWMPLITSGAPLSADTLIEQWQQILAGLAKGMLPFFGLVVLLAVGVNMLQTGFLFVPGKPLPDLSRLNPLAGLSRLASTSNVVRLAMALVKVAIVGAVAWKCVYDQRYEILSLGTRDLPAVAGFVWEFCFWTCLKAAGALLVLGALDYGYQRWKFERDLRMTPQEMREEMRNLQGDPQTAARRRDVERQLVQGRFAQTVPRATLIIIDRGKLAIALLYDERSMDAPQVVAKGAGRTAARIELLAREHAVRIAEDKTLAAELYRSADVKRAIPPALFTPVARALAKNGARAAAIAPV
jgi:flagellar biosynthesis protein FlhB